jgi:predicted phage-related endonuclease
MSQHNRPRGIGSSDAANIVGCGFDTALHTYLACIGEPVPKDQHPLLEMGTFLEDFISRQYEYRTGYRLTPAGPWDPHPCYPFLFSSIDRLVERYRDRAVELKYTTTWEGWGPDGSDEVPDKYLIQAMHQMLTSGLTTIDVAAIGPRADLRVYPLSYRPDLIDALLSVELHFWHEHVERRVPPEPDWKHPDSARLFDLINRPKAGETVELDASCDLAAVTYDMASERLKVLQGQKAEARAWLAERMGTAALGLLPSGRTVKRTLARDGSVRLTISKPKEGK